MTSENEDRLKQAFHRKANVLRRKPTAGRGVARTRVRVVDGATCEIEEGQWRIVCDLPPGSGGRDHGPNPGVLGRGALGSCLAMTYMMWAAKDAIRIDSLEVEILAEYDAGSHYGVSDAPPGYLEVRYLVRVESPASLAEITRVLDDADRHTAYLDVFARPQTMRRELHLVAPREV